MNQIKIVAAKRKSNPECAAVNSQVCDCDQHEGLHRHRCANNAYFKAGDDGKIYCKQHAAMPHTWKL